GVLRQPVTSFTGRMEAGLRRRLEEGRVRLELLSRRPALSRPGDLVAQWRQRVDDHWSALERAVRQRVESHERRLVFLAGQLDALSPLATLARGYAIGRRRDTGAVVRSGREVETGTPVAVRVQDAEIWGRVEAVRFTAEPQGEGNRP